MKQRQYKNFLLTIGFAIFVLSACCEPKQKNSFPTVIPNSYNDTGVKDAHQFMQIDSSYNPLDSAYYPVYSLDIQNTGTEADTFYLSYSRIRNGYSLPLTVQQFVNAGETKTFKTLGPIPSDSQDSLRVKYYSFYVKTIDSISLFVLHPTINIHYGQNPNGPEQCGSPGSDISVDISKLKHK